MLQEPKLQMIQFPHPIWEDRADIGGVKPWNRSAHKRNFIVLPGEAIVSKGAEPKRFENISFWGEWEPEAKIVKHFDKADSPITPRRLIAPLFPKDMPEPSGDNCCGNTDPFVFGEHFKYSNCRQNIKGRPNRLQYLSAGSLILFGGIYRGDFWLDTVFVVKDEKELPYKGGLSYKGCDCQNQKMQNFLGADYPFFHAATLKPIAASSDMQKRHYTLYRGQNWQENPNYFSFVPCDVNGRAFSKVRLTSEMIQNLGKGALTFKVLGEYEEPNPTPQAVWEKIVDEVFAQGLSLGVRFDNVLADA